jgi:hypothetical protein
MRVPCGIEATRQRIDYQCAAIQIRRRRRAASAYDSP